MAPLSAPLPGCCNIILFVQLFSLCIHGLFASSTYSFFLFIQLFSVFSFLYCWFFYDTWSGVCWGVWCAISRIIKLTINDFCSQTNSCVTQWAAVNDAVHISCFMSIWMCSHCLSTWNPIHCFIRRSSVSSCIPTYIHIYVNANMQTL